MLSLEDKDPKPVLDACVNRLQQCPRPALRPHLGPANSKSLESGEKTTEAQIRVGLQFPKDYTDLR